MANKTINLQPYFKIDEIATRWALSRDAVMSYGIDGQLKFGLFATGNLHVEVGSFGPPPDFDFAVESSGFWSGFIPIKPEMVAALHLNGASDRWHIPDTDGGKSVRALAYVPHDECDEGPRLMVAGNEVERFEREVLQACEKPAACPLSGAGGVSPDEWKRGLKLFAWQEAAKLVERENALPGPALWLALCSRDDVKVKGRDSDKIEPKTIQNGWVRGEVGISKTQVCGQWRTKLENLLLPAKA